MAEPGAEQAVRFRHDRIQEAILRGLDPHRRRELQLAMARRLAGVPELFAVAAEQYLPVVDAIDDARRAASGWWSCCGAPPTGARSLADHALVDTLLGAALPLVDPRRDRHARRGAHRPPCRPVQPRTAGRGGRGVPHASSSCARPRWSARTRRRCRSAA